MALRCDKLWGGSLAARRQEMQMLADETVEELMYEGNMTDKMTQHEFIKNKALFESLLAKVASYLCKTPSSRHNQYPNKRKLSDYGLCTNYRFKYRRDALYVKLGWSYSDTEEFTKAALNVNAKVRRKAHAIVKMMPLLAL